MAQYAEAPAGKSNGPSRIPEAHVVEEKADAQVFSHLHLCAVLGTYSHTHTNTDSRTDIK